MNEIRKERKTGRVTGIRTLQVLFRIIYASRSGIPQKKKKSRTLETNKEPDHIHILFEYGPDKPIFWYMYDR